ncbi:N-acetylmuramate alpha-1-phosphate uridylyltransferase MurU [Marinimicrobium sp. ABcell2]|uniref:N-acetylmuramate alpha-1-phosphate uridylyltransferase MurU n=1 Tax=Marinimicrobium sp. ABcell2 TaxID=3069751 RepID=UPI0027ADE7C3|nr:nucleotidyltransferase family protein [Marinimicrobium sp. ABcell2]MDQ2077588.1 nucleotidyltransferase family protein [Marinimicrobium sp. ABcell2]
MILAAGLGKRMRPLTDDTPKPLLKLAGKPLLQYHLESLAASGVREVIINLAYLGDHIRAFVGDGSRFGIQVTYSPEPEPLETGGAIAHALPLLGEAPFLLINGDVWTDYDPTTLANRPLRDSSLGRLLLVPNPDFHPRGDFGLSTDGYLTHAPEHARFTFAGISLLRPALIRDYPDKRSKFPLLEALNSAIAEQRLEGEVHTGSWSDVGTPERLHSLQSELASRPQ